MEDAKSILTRWATMAADRAPWDSAWQDVADYALPRKGNITTTESGPGTNAANRLYDTTAIQAVSTLASGHASAITPAGTQWFAWEAPDEIKSDSADKWYNKCSEKTRKILTAGNFHTMLNEVFEDRSGFGLGCLMALPNAARKISFQAHPIGSFAIEEDSEGNVDTVFLRREYSVRQLVQLFGEAVILENEKLAKAWEKFKEKGVDSNHYVIHAVFPRVERDATKLDAINMPIASVWVAEAGKSVLKRSGFEEMPIMVTRYLKRSGSKQQYGYSPFETIRAAIVDANKTKQILQVVGQKLAVPPVLVPDNLIGNVDMRPGGKTVYRAVGNNAMPHEWLSGGNPQGMQEQLIDAREQIRAAYHTDLFRMFTEREKQMTAREVSELAAEKLMPFSPSFTRFTADFQVMMEAIFAILFRAGVFGSVKDGTIPPEVIRVLPDGRGEIPPPKVIYQSRIALAIRQAETAAADRMVERAMNYAQVDPSIMDNIDGDAWIRGSGRNDGVTEEVLRSEKARDAIREARAEAEAQQAQLDQAQQAADAAGKVGMKISTPEQQ